VFCSKREKRLQAEVSQIDPRVLERFADAVKIGRVYGPFKGSTPETPRWRYVTQSEAGVRQLFEVLSPWLGEVKQEQFRRAIAHFDAKFTRVEPGSIAHLHAPGVSAGNPRRKKVV